jgi:hypothetical protein
MLAADLAAHGHASNTVSPRRQASRDQASLW